MPNPSTKKEYRHGIKKFCEWDGKSAEEILEMRKDGLTQRVEEGLIKFKNRDARFGKEIEKFHSYLLAEGFTINTERNKTLGTRWLFMYYQMQTILRRGSKETKITKTTISFPLAIGHVRAVFKVADHRQKVILCVAIDPTLWIGDFVALRENSPQVIFYSTELPFLLRASMKIAVNGKSSETAVSS